MSGKSPGQAACEAFRAAVVDEVDPADAWAWAQERGVTSAWEAAAKAACEAHGHAVGLMDLAVANSQLHDRLAAQHDAMTQLRSGRAEALAAVTAERDEAREDWQQLRTERDEIARRLAEYQAENDQLQDENAKLREALAGNSARIAADPGTLRARLAALADSYDEAYARNTTEALRAETGKAHARRLRNRARMAASFAAELRKLISPHGVPDGAP